jgi:hypothetical protein
MSKPADYAAALAHIHNLESDLRDRDDKIKRLQADLGEARDLVDKMRERLQDATDNVDNWISVFDLRQNEAGVYVYDREQSEVWERHAELMDVHNKLVRKWNKFVGEYNGTVRPRDIGRPLAASEAQRADVLKRNKAKQSIRAIAAATSLSVRTVRTIVEKAAGKDRATKRVNELRRVEFDRQRAALYRARKARRDAVPKRATEWTADAAALLKQAKGLGRG